MQHSPLEVNPQTGELFLRLASPHENIIITPPRHSDVQRLTEIAANPLVYEFMGGLMPLDEEKATTWIKKWRDLSDNVIQKLTENEEGGWLDGCPVRSIRETYKDGTDLYLGDIDLRRCIWHEINDSDGKSRLIAENNARSAGDPEIFWQVADFLAQSHWRRGIMSATLSEILRAWARPRMNVCKIRVSVFADNIGSIRMFEKNGFKVVEQGIIDDRVVQVLEWRTA
ncbi:hypothetical protein C8J56DRAFT_1001346 [Mycena floridula]|nr:hypothetical protein C8J56DRAFT_1001346 [Mycena floridula]